MDRRLIHWVDVFMTPLGLPDLIVILYHVLANSNIAADRTDVMLSVSAAMLCLPFKFLVFKLSWRLAWSPSRTRLRVCGRWPRRISAQQPYKLQIITSLQGLSKNVPCSGLHEDSPLPPFSIDMLHSCQLIRQGPSTNPVIHADVISADMENME